MISVDMGNQPSEGGSEDIDKFGDKNNNAEGDNLQQSTYEDLETTRSEVANNGQLENRLLNKDMKLLAEIKLDNQDYGSYLKRLREEGSLLRADDGQPSKFDERPDWLDEKQIEQAQKIYRKHFMAINFAHLTGLLLLVRIDSIHRTLKKTGESDSCAKLFKRYYSTLMHVKKWYEGNLMDSKDCASLSLQMVRGMHNKVSTKFNDGKNIIIDQNLQQGGCPAMTMPDEIGHRVGSASSCGEQQHERANDCHHRITISGQKHISQYDIMLTQFAFVGFIVTHPEKVGFLDNFTREELTSLLHFWRLIGHYLGAPGKFNLCSYELEDIIGLCKAMNQYEYHDSIRESNLQSHSAMMSLNIARAVKFIPMITYYGMMKHAYAMLNLDPEVLEQKRTWFSALSYYLIDLVMCQFLAYPPLRAFNNGLIRLSIYLVGKFERWYSDHLESSHGPVLRP